MSEQKTSGVPDGYMPIPTAEQIADALENVRCFHDMGAELIAPRLLANLLAAPIVKESLSVAPSLPAAGSAGEEVEVRGLQWLDTGHYRKNPPQFGYNPHDWNPLMTVAQHERIVAALSAQQSAHVSVPRELLADLVSQDHDTRVQAERRLYALLNGGEA